jgi:hypothetical protein
MVWLKTKEKQMKQMTAPHALTVGSSRYIVRLVRTMPKQGCMGEVHYTDKTITLATHCKVTDRKYSAEEFNDTFWHELTHATLFEMGHPLYDNEQFVTKFARTFSGAINTAEFA